MPKRTRRGKRELRPSDLAKMSPDQVKSKGYIRIPGFTRADGTKVKAHFRKMNRSETRDKAIDELVGAAEWVGDATAGNIGRALQGDKESIGKIVDFTPVVGDIKAYKESVDAFSKGNILEGSLLGLAGTVGLVPFVGDAASKGLKGLIKQYKRVPASKVSVSGEKFGVEEIMDALETFKPKSKLTPQQVRYNLDQGTLPYDAIEAIGKYADNPVDVRTAYKQLSEQGVQGNLAARGIADSQSGLVGGLSDNVIEEGYRLVPTAGTAQAVKATGKNVQEKALVDIASGTVDKSSEGYRSVAAKAAFIKANPDLADYDLLFHGSTNTQLLKDMKDFSKGDYSAGLGLGGQSHTWLGDSPLVASAAESGFSGGKGIVIAVRKGTIKGDLTQVPRQVGTKIIGGSNQIAQNTGELLGTLSNSIVRDIDLSGDAIEKSIKQFSKNPKEILKYSDNAPKFKPEVKTVASSAKLLEVSDKVVDKVMVVKTLENLKRQSRSGSFDTKELRSILKEEGVLTSKINFSKKSLDKLSEKYGQAARLNSVSATRKEVKELLNGKEFRKSFGHVIDTIIR